MLTMLIWNLYNYWDTLEWLIIRVAERPTIEMLWPVTSDLWPVTLNIKISKLERLPTSRPKGYFIPPTIITGLADDHKCCQDEIFGPVTCLTVFDTEGEVVERVNQTRYDFPQLEFILVFRKSIFYIDIFFFLFILKRNFWKQQNSDWSRSLSESLMM